MRFDQIRELEVSDFSPQDLRLFSNQRELDLRRYFNFNDEVISAISSVTRPQAVAMSHLVCDIINTASSHYRAYLGSINYSNVDIVRRLFIKLDNIARPDGVMSLKRSIMQSMSADGILYAITRYSPVELVIMGVVPIDMITCLRRQFRGASPRIQLEYMDSIGFLDRHYQSSVESTEQQRMVESSLGVLDEVEVSDVLDSSIYSVRSTPRTFDWGDALRNVSVQATSGGPDSLIRPPNPVRLSPQPEDVGPINPWIPWSGGTCPVPVGIMIVYKINGSDRINGPTTSEILRWSHTGGDGDINSYSVVRRPTGGWIPWGGGARPVPANIKVYYKTGAGGMRGPREARGLRWDHVGSDSDILEYKVFIEELISLAEAPEPYTREYTETQDDLIKKYSDCFARYNGYTVKILGFTRSKHAEVARLDSDEPIITVSDLSLLDHTFPKVGYINNGMTATFVQRLHKRGSDRYKKGIHPSTFKYTDTCVLEMSRARLSYDRRSIMHNLLYPVFPEYNEAIESLLAYEKLSIALSSSICISISARLGRIILEKNCKIIGYYNVKKKSFITYTDLFNKDLDKLGIKYTFKQIKKLEGLCQE
jgi:hypothetical protein